MMLSRSTKDSHIFKNIIGASILAGLCAIGPPLHRWMQSVADLQRDEALRDYYQIETRPNFVSPSAHPLLWQKLQNESLWRACDKITKGTTRFWYYPPNPPRNVFEEMAKFIYQDTPYWNEAESFEYWCNILEVSTDDDTDHPQRIQHPWHTDRDEDILDQEKRFVVPLRGAVYYGYSEFEGGEFQIVNSVPYKQTPDIQPSPTDQCHASSQMCITNPSHLHADQSALYVPVRPNMLLMANVTYFHKVAPISKGQRLSLAVNADHWRPYVVETTPTDDEMLQLAKTHDVFPERDRSSIFRD